jgi:transcriptional/translational regulatory protein YebC/TACO1
MAEPGAVGWQFSRKGVILAKGSEDEVMMVALDAGADDVESDAETHAITTSVENFGAVRAALEAKFGEPKRATLVFKPNVTVPLDEEGARAVLDLIEALEDNDDVQTVTANFEVADSVLAKLSA